MSPLTLSDDGAPVEPANADALRTPENKPVAVPSRPRSKSKSFHRFQLALQSIQKPNIENLLGSARVDTPAPGESKQKESKLSQEDADALMTSMFDDDEEDDGDLVSPDTSLVQPARPSSQPPPIVRPVQPPADIPEQKRPQTRSQVPPPVQPMVGPTTRAQSAFQNFPAVLPNGHSVKPDEMTLIPTVIRSIVGTTIGPSLLTDTDRRTLAKQQRGSPAWNRAASQIFGRIMGQRSETPGLWKSYWNDNGLGNRFPPKKGKGMRWRGPQWHRLGHFEISTRHLRGGRLRVRYARNKQSVADMPTASLSRAGQHMVINLLRRRPSDPDLHFRLHPSERSCIEKLVRRVSKRQRAIDEGEIEAGNNNPALRQFV